MRTDRLTAEQLADATRKMVVVYRHHFELRLYGREKDDTEFTRRGRWPCALGAQAYRTPHGVYIVLRKAMDPDWSPPDSAWVGPELRDRAGKPITLKGGDARNPIKGAFLALDDSGVGIHGTADVDSIGTRASHGCIRVLEEVAEELYRRVPVGCPVVIT